jgi:hypothetical protein
MIVKANCVSNSFSFVGSYSIAKPQLMRKITFLAIACCFSVFANAQISKGSRYLGGSVAYSQSKEEDTAPTAYNENKNFIIAPAMGFALKENLITGIDFFYSSSESINRAPGNTIGKTRSAGVGVFMRRFYPIAKKFYAFGQARVGYFDKHATIAGITGSTSSSTTDGWGLEAGIYPGITYNIAKAFYLEMGFNNLLNISYAKEERTVVVFGNPSTFKQNSFSIGSSLSSGHYLSVGARFIIPKK